MEDFMDSFYQRNAKHNIEAGCYCALCEQPSIAGYYIIGGREVCDECGDLLLSAEEIKNSSNVEAQGMDADRKL